MLSQRRLAGSQMGMSAENLDQAEPILADLFAALVDAPTFEEGLEAGRELLTPGAMEALGAPRDTPSDVVFNQFGTPWFRLFLSYDPVPNLAGIDVPVLALNGSLDVQVPADENLPAIAAALEGNPDATVMKLEGFNHLFQNSETGAIGEHADIAETFDEGTLELIVRWINERFGER